MTQAHSKSLWSEPAGSGSTPSVQRAVIVRDGVGDWTAVDGNVGTGALYSPLGEGYDIYDLAAEVFFVSDGHGGVTLDTAGTPIAIAVSDGAGGVTPSTDFTQPRAARLFKNSIGVVNLIPNSIAPALLIDVGGVIHPL